MLFSLILPIYGVEKYIAACIESCCGQIGVDFDDYEILLIDDASPDKSIEIAKQILNKYNGVNYRIISRPNGGLSAARNTGLKHATGQYIWFIDSDDNIDPESLMILKQTLRSHPDVEIISFGHRNIYPQKSVDCHLPQQLIDCVLPGIKVVDQTAFYSAWNKIYKRSTLSEYGMEFREGILWEDGEFNLRLLPLIKSHFGLSDILYNYIRRPGSISTSNKVKHTLNSDLIKFESVYDWFASRNIDKNSFKILCRRNSEAIVFFFAGIPQLEKTERKVFLAKIKPLKSKIKDSFKTSDNSVHKLIYLMLSHCPNLLAKVLGRRMQKILRAEENLYTE